MIGKIEQGNCGKWSVLAGMQPAPIWDSAAQSAPNCSRTDRHRRRLRLRVFTVQSRRTLSAGCSSSIAAVLVCLCLPVHLDRPASCQLHTEQYTLLQVLSNIDTLPDRVLSYSTPPAPTLAVVETAAASPEAVQSGVRDREWQSALGPANRTHPKVKHRHRDCLCDVQQSSDDCILHQCITQVLLPLPAPPTSSPTTITFAQGW